MKHILKVIFISILTSLYIFPFNTVWLPAVNTKMVLAAVGLILFIYKGAMARNAQVSLHMFSVSIYALLVSMAGLITVTINNTYDYSAPAFSKVIISQNVTQNEGKITMNGVSFIVAEKL